MTISTFASIAALGLISSASGGVVFNNTPVASGSTAWTTLPVGATHVAGFNYGGAATSFGGFSFAAAGAGSYNTNGGITVSYSVPSSAWSTAASGLYNAGIPLLATGALTYPSANGALEFSGLTVGQTYTIQFALADSRGTAGSPPNGRQFEIAAATVSGPTVTLTGDTSTRLTYAYINGDYGVISATFTADGTGKAAFLPRVYEANNSAVGTQINAIRIMAISAPTPPSADGVWTNASGGNWTTAANWAGNTPAFGTGKTADFSTLALSTNPTVTPDSAWVIGTMRIDDQNPTQHAWGIGSGSPITMAVDTGAPVIENNVPVTIDTALAGTQGLSKSGTGTLTLAGNNTYSGTTVVASGVLKLGTTAGALPPNLRVMPLGDSITYGGSGTNAGYRGYLHSQLNPAAHGYRFEGVATINPGSLPVTPVDQTHHNGYSSYATLDLSNNLDGVDLTRYNQLGGADRNPNGGYWLTGGHGTGRNAVTPDVVLLMVGANDIYQEAAYNNPSINVANYGANLTTLINKILTLSPKAKVIVADISPWPAQSAKVTAINNAVNATAANLQSQGKAVSVVDMNTLFPANGLSADGLHPNDTGYAFMAGQWNAAIQAVYGGVAVSNAIPAGSSVVVSNDAVLDLGGNRAGAGELAVDSGSTLKASFDSTTKTIANLQVAGNISLAGTLALNDSAATPAVMTYGTKLTLLSYTGTLTGLFSGHAEGTNFSAAGNRFRIRYADSNAVTLEVLSATDFGDWMKLYPNVTSEVDKLPTADPDGDGAINQFEYAFGLDPSKGSSVTPVISTINRADGRFSYQRRDNDFTHLIYQAWTSTDLVHWTQDTSAVQDDSSGPDANGVESVSVTLSGVPLTAPQLFVRLTTGPDPAAN